MSSKFRKELHFTETEASGACEMSFRGDADSYEYERFEYRAREARESLEQELQEKIETELDRMLEESVRTPELTAKQEVAEQTHRETKESMLEQHRHCMNPEQVRMLESEETAEHLHVMESEDYVERFREIPFDVVGHCDSNGEIYIKNLDKPVVEHVATHETMHLCANREKTVERDGAYVIRSGLRESRFEADGREVDRNRAANEGTTELYTLRELAERGETDAVYAVSAYSESRMWMQRVENLVGRETLEEAYFGDNRRTLETKFNALNEYPRAWNEFSENLDILEYSDNRLEVANAKSQLAKQYARMFANKYGK